MTTERQLDREFPGADAADDAMLRHVVAVGSTWFAAYLLAAAVVLCGLLAAGWRPARLPGMAEAAWWLGALVTTAGLGCLLWAGCPAVVGDLRKAASQKSWTVRIGVVLGLLGFLVVAVTLLLLS